MARGGGGGCANPLMIPGLSGPPTPCGVHCWALLKGIVKVPTAGEELRPLSLRLFEPPPPPQCSGQVTLPFGEEEGFPLPS